MTHHTFLWHDYETFGIDPRRDRPAQFAAIRTDAELNEIDDPINLFCAPAPDYLPAPVATLITGITPQRCLQEGLPEHQFAAAIEKAFSVPGTIGVGYNTIRFDDEVTRFLFWRNLFDPYAREWQNRCGRWDLLDVMRLAHALRPDGIQWPRVEGKTSFKLELLAAENGLLHERAHDALSDVRATIALARLLKNSQPKLFDFALKLRQKDQVGSEISLAAPKPFLHVSGMFPAERGCLAVMWPLAAHPANKNEIICWDLAEDPAQLASLNAEQVRQRVFTATADLPEDMTRLPLKTVRLNRSPMVVGTLRPYADTLANRWQVDLPTIEQHAQAAAELPDLSSLWRAVYAPTDANNPDKAAPAEAENDLYGGFISSSDRQQLDRLRQTRPAQLAAQQPAFSDHRLDDLLLRYRARNFPETLNPEEQQSWQEYRAAKLIGGADGERNLDTFLEELDQCAQMPGVSDNQQKQEWLEALHEYAETLVSDLDMAP